MRDDPGVTSESTTDLAGELAAVIGTVIRLLRRRVPTEVGPGSLAALATLHRGGPMRLGDLAAREGVSPPTLTRMIAALEDAGYVRRRPDDHDRRAVVVSITGGGTALVRQAQTARAEVLRARLAALTEAQREALVAALPALEALADDGF